MKESIGGTWIFAICMTFIVLFTGYLAISVNYSKAFKLKSSIVNDIEEAEGYESIRDKVRMYLTSQGYSAYGECPNFSSTEWRLIDTIDDSAPVGGNYHNVCIYKMDVLTTNDDICDDRAYYKVVTFFKFDLPVLNVLLTYKVSGDTDYILAGQNSCVR